MERINIIDAGCRYGVYPTMKGVEPLDYYGFDPDESEIKRLNNKYSGDNYRFYPYALSNQNNICEYHTLLHHGQSSLHRPNKNSIWFSKTRIGECEIEKTRKIICKTIDSFCDNNDIVLDFIKTDTEGHDYKVLLGAEKQLSNVLGIRCEAQFEEVFEDSGSFIDIHKYLVMNNFILLNLDYDGRGSPQTYFASSNKFGILTGTDACYIKKFDSVNSNIRLIKLALFCFLNNATDVGFDVMNYYKDSGGVLPFKKSKIVDELKLQFSKEGYKLKNLPGERYILAKEHFYDYFGEEFPDNHSFYESNILNPI